MELSVNERLLMTMGQLKDVLTMDSLERVLGKNLLSNNVKKDKNFQKNDYAGFEQLLVEDTIENLYGLILTRPEAFATAIALKDLKMPNSVKGYCQNMQKIFDDLVKFEDRVKFAVENKQDKDYILFSFERVRVDFVDFMCFMRQVMPFFDVALKAEKLSRKTIKASEEFFELIPDYNEQVRTILDKAAPFIKDWRSPGVVFSERYDDIKSHFDDNSKYVDAQKVVYNDVQERIKAELESRRQAVKVPEISQEEFERRRCIQEANMMYDELVQNTMRDLEKQVPYSVREMYDYFVNVKFAKFVKSFSMPLSASTKIGVAREVCNPLSELNNYISKISENATTTNVYMMKE